MMLGTLDGRRVSLQELHRFPSAAIKIGGTFRWDVLRVFEELKTGMREAAKLGVPVSGISTDSWGVDYAWIRADEPLVGVPFHYRDARNDDAFERVFAKVPAGDVFARTGIQFMPFNTVFQLDEDARSRPWIFSSAEQFLNIADYFNWLMSGVGRVEESMASTTQLYDPVAREWALDLADKIGVPRQLFPPLVASGSRLGPILPAIAAETGLAQDVQVLATCSHDTGAAVAAVPAEGENWAYLSSGTWSLLGVELQSPKIDKLSQELNFTNEGGYGGTTRFLKNIVGLWIIQECRRAWLAEGREFNYEELTSMAASAEPLRSLISPAAPRFAKPGDMPEKVRSFCSETGQPVPESPGQIVRCAIESLALIYRKTVAELERASGAKVDRIHIVGGGSRNALLNQCAADATGRTVLAGPVEATATGNVLIQALALGHISSLAELRSTVRASFEVTTFAPREAAAWDAAYERFCRLPEDK